MVLGKLAFFGKYYIISHTLMQEITATGKYYDFEKSVSDPRLARDWIQENILLTSTFLPVRSFYMRFSIKAALRMQLFRTPIPRKRNLRGNDFFFSKIENTRI